MNTFRKEERLKSKKLIAQLFENGKSANVPGLKLVWIPVSFESSFPAQASFSVAKRNFPKAVVRNRIKRLMREAYRLQKQELYSFLSEKKIQVAMMLIFTGRQMPEFKPIQEKISTILQWLKENV